MEIPVHLNEQIELEKSASTARRIGLEAIYGLKAHSYGVSLDEGRLLALDCFLMIGEYDDPVYFTDELAIDFVEHERQRLVEQADFIGEYLERFVNGATAVASED